MKFPALCKSLLVVWTAAILMVGVESSASAETVILNITGNIDAEYGPNAEFTETQLREMPWHQLKTSTVVTDGVHLFEGVLMLDILKAVGAEGETVTAMALNDYAIDIPFEDFTRFDVLLARQMAGKLLSTRDKGPLWIVYPRDDHVELQDIRYDYRWVWQLTRLHIE